MKQYNKIKFYFISGTYLWSIIFSIFFFGGCKKKDDVLSGIENNQEISLKTSKGFYVSADRSRSNQLIANRKNVGDWEKFSISLLDHNSIALKSTNHFYISYRNDSDGFLYANDNILNENSILTIVPADSTGFVIKNNSNKYISIDSYDVLKANQDKIINADTFYFDKTTKKQYSNFSFIQLIPFIVGLLLLLISMILFQINENKKISILLLLLGALSIRIFIAIISPNLHWWDEQFHALVAKNMMDNPFKPMLYVNPVLPFDYKSWILGHVWLHKQPLFSWQMALSLKLFGINILALRLPSIIMSTLVTFFIYRIGKLSLNHTAAYFAALLFALSNFSIEIAGGAIATDHNDVAFLFYISASVWAWVEYENSNSSRKKYFLILIGLFSGCAVLVKWLVGLLVYSGWGLSILFSKERRIQKFHYFHLLVSAIISFIIFLPWQIYIFYTYPLESKYEFELNTRHFFETVEGHGGDFWFHFNIAHTIYGLSIYLLLFFIIVFFRSIKNRVYYIAFFTYIVLIYLLYSLAETKMNGFTYCISFIIFLAMGTFLDKYFKLLILNPEYFPLRIHKIIYTTIVLVILSGFNINFERIREIHTSFRKDELSHLSQRLRTAPLINNLASVIPNIQEYVIFNCRDEDNIPIMFFNNVVAAYSPMPSNETLIEIKQKGYKIAVFDDDKLPDYIRSDQSVLKIDENYWNEK